MNNQFPLILHEVITNHIYDSPAWIERAKTVKDGWLQVVDGRNAHPWHRPPSEDIFGLVFLKDGVMQPDTYSPMPTYRMLTPDGFPQLDPYLDTKLNERVLDK